MKRDPKKETSAIVTFNRHIKSLTELKLKDFKSVSRTIAGRPGYAIELFAPNEVDQIMNLFNQGGRECAEKISRRVMFVWFRNVEVTNE